ncbi:MAG: bifunctional sugar-1-phosphate nucleotidylyltransferase/acetyltransferase [Candidatus Helarchaeota archaeon]
MKTLILAGGAGSRLAPLTRNMPKPMISIGGKPTIQHVIENLQGAGLNDFLIVVGYKKEQIMDFLGNGYDLGCRIEYIEQKKIQNIEAAILCAKKALDEESEFLISHADIFVEPELIKRAIKQFNELEADGIISVTLVDDPSFYGIVDLDPDAKIKRIIEKPQKGTQPSNYAAAGIYIFKPELLVQLSEDRKLDKAIQNIIEKNGTIYASVWEKDWVEIRFPWDLLKANKYVLEKQLKGKGIFIAESATISENAVIKGPAYISNNVKIRSGAQVKGPCFIGENVFIGNNSLIRTYTTLGKNVVIGFGVEIRNSIIFEGTAIGRLSFIGDSVIGKNVEFRAGISTSNLPFDRRLNEIKSIGNVKMSLDGQEVVIPVEKFGTIIGDNVLISNNVSINAGKTIGENSIIMPNTLIDQDIEPNSVAYSTQKLELRKRNDI